MDNKTKELLRTTLKRHGFSVTKARELVLELLWNQEPQSMHTIYTHASRHIDRASLYRIIRIFEQAGIVQKVYVGWKYKLELTDVFLHHHHHITCLGCGKIIAIKQDDEVERLIHELSAKEHVTAVTHQLEIQGYCEQCQKLK